MHTKVLLKVMQNELRQTCSDNHITNTERVCKLRIRRNLLEVVRRWDSFVKTSTKIRHMWLFNRWSSVINNLCNEKASKLCARISEDTQSKCCNNKSTIWQSYSHSNWTVFTMSAREPLSPGGHRWRNGRCRDRDEWGRFRSRSRSPATALDRASIHNALRGLGARA